MKEFLRWLLGLSRRDDEHRKGDGRQRSQLIESSHRRVERALESGDREYHKLRESSNQLRDNLELMLQRLHRMKEQKENDKDDREIN